MILELPKGLGSFARKFLFSSSGVDTLLDEVSEETELTLLSEFGPKSDGLAHGLALGLTASPSSEPSRLSRDVPMVVVSSMWYPCAPRVLPPLVQLPIECLRLERPVNLDSRLSCVLTVACDWSLPPLPLESAAEPGRLVGLPTLLPTMLPAWLHIRLTSLLPALLTIRLITRLPPRLPCGVTKALPRALPPKDPPPAGVL